MIHLGIRLWFAYGMGQESMGRNETTLERALRDEVIAQCIRLELFLHLLDRMFEASAPFTLSTARSLLVASILKVRQSARAAQLLAEDELVEEEIAGNVPRSNSAGEELLGGIDFVVGHLPFSSAFTAKLTSDFKAGASSFDS